MGEVIVRRAVIESLSIFDGLPKSSNSSSANHDSRAHPNIPKPSTNQETLSCDVEGQCTFWGRSSQICRYLCLQPTLWNMRKLPCASNTLHRLQWWFLGMLRCGSSWHRIEETEAILEFPLEHRRRWVLSRLSRWLASWPRWFYWVWFGHLVAHLCCK